MTDGELTAALANLGLDRHNYRAVALLPLIEVAWADGRVQRAERELIGRIAARYGLELGDQWLERWLKRRPTASTFLAARTVLLALMARSGRDTSAPESLQALIDLCQRVAEAAGGLFGLAFTVERAERECIEEIAHHLALGPAIPDTIVRAWKTSRRAPPPKARRKAPPLKPGFSEATTRIRPRRVRKQEAFPEDDPTTPFEDDLGSALAPTGYVLEDDD